MMGNVDPDHNVEMNSRPNEEEDVDQGRIKLVTQLPEQLLLEILIRLPSKSASRFKLVCRDWCSLISTTYFTSCYMKHRCQDASRTFTLVYTIDHGAPNSGYLQDIKAVSNHPDVSKIFQKKCIDHALRHPLKRSPNYTPRMELYVQAACHDLMLYSDPSKLNFCAVNLRTRDCVVLPPVPQLHGQPSVIWDRKPGLLCYHDQNKGNYEGCRFKLILVPVVKSGCFRSKGRGTLESPRFSIDIYCSETKQWSVVNIKWYPMKLNSFLNYGSPPIIAHDGMLHWLIGFYLVSVDPCSAHLQHRLGRAVRLPKKHNWSLLGVCGGNIRVVGRRREKGKGLVFNVWDLHHKSWLLAHKIVIPNSFIRDLTYQLLAVHPYDADSIFVFRGHSKMVYLFNMRTNTVEDYHKLKVSGGCRFAALRSQASLLLH
ncbi:hypothetical protein RND81_14G116200 [Saponaria officinalis]|uniref:F-box domain-containing protein n=1 Tax=Saponaria officinalis TaxID=3572 RepID=A0AAW1GSW2_SAPOF